MKDASGDVAAAGYGIAERVNSELRRHPIGDRVAHDPVRVDVFDRATVELAFARLSSSRPMLRDIRKPDPVRGVGAELPLHVIIEHRWPGFLALPAPAALRTGVFRHR